MSILSLHDITERIFAPNGIISQDLGLEYRAEQHRYAINVATWLSGSDGAHLPVALLEGETGIGKSLGYLLPLVVHLSLTGRRALVSTFTVNLIHQLQYDLVTINAVIDKLSIGRISIANRLGITQYASSSMISMSAKQCTNLTKRKALIEWAKRIDSGHGAHVYGKWWVENGINAIEDRHTYQLTEACSEKDYHWYKHDCEQAESAQLVFTSHAVTALVSKGFALFSSASLPFDYIIADEADQLSAMAESISEHRSQPAHQSNNLRELDKKIKWQSQRICTLALRELDSLQRFFDGVGERYPNKAYLMFAEMPVDLQEDFLARAKKLENTLQPLLDRAQAVGTCLVCTMELQDFIANLNGLSSLTSQRCISWSKVTRKGSMASGDPLAGVSIGRWVKGISDRQPPVRMLLTSGTLSISQRLGLERYHGLRAQLGISIDKIGLHDRHAPTQFGYLSFVFPDPELHAPFKTDYDFSSNNEHSSYHQSWLQYVAIMLETCVSSGPTLCLCPSFREVTKLSELTELTELTSLRVGFHLPGQSLQKLTSLLVKGELRAIVTPSAWEGINIRQSDGSQLLNNVMVTRVPFSPPNKATEAIMASSFKANGYTQQQAMSAVYSRVIDAALRKLKQGLIGRGIRANNDKITAWIADPRVGPSAKYSLDGVIPRRFIEDYACGGRLIINSSGKGEIHAPDNGNKEVLAWL